MNPLALVGMRADLCYRGGGIWRYREKRRRVEAQNTGISCPDRSGLKAHAEEESTSATLV